MQKDKEMNQISFDDLLWMDWFDADGLPMIVKPVAWMPMDKPAEPWQGDNSDA